MRQTFKVPLDSLSEMKPYYDDGRGIVIYHGRYQSFAPFLPEVDAVITDPPFSARTHKGFDSSARGNAGEGKDEFNRKELGYSPWGEPEIMEFCKLVNPSGWMVIITDHSLAPHWEAWQSGRYVFAPLPSFTPGRSVRLSGDGPSSWTDWIIVSRPASLSTWGTLPGGYVNRVEKLKQQGGKPISLMTALVRDYSRTGDLILDPCMGSGTTLLAAKELGRIAIGIDVCEKSCEIAALRLEQEVLPFRKPVDITRETGILIPDGTPSAASETAIPSRE